MEKKLYMCFVIGMIMMLIGIVIDPSTTLGTILGLCGLTIFMFPMYYDWRIKKLNPTSPNR